MWLNMYTQRIFFDMYLYHISFDVNVNTEYCKSIFMNILRYEYILRI